MIRRLYLLAGQKRLKDEYKDPDMLSKVNKAGIVEMMEGIKEYLYLNYGVGRVPLAYIIRRSIIVQTYGDYSKYKNPDYDIITRFYTYH